MKNLENLLCLLLCAVLSFALASCGRSEEGNIPYTDVTVPPQNVVMADLDPIAAAKLMGDKTEIGKVFDNEESFSDFARQIDDAGLCDTYNADYFKTGDLVFAGVKTKSNIGYGLTAVNLVGDVLTVTLEHFEADADDAAEVYIGVFVETEKIYAKGIKTVIVEVV